jgi:hypothetical protein
VGWCAYIDVCTVCVCVCVIEKSAIVLLICAACRYNENCLFGGRSKRGDNALFVHHVCRTDTHMHAH